MKKDFIAGFLVFLIALPLCLGISIASGFPPISGVFTAIVGGLITPWFTNSNLTIKGPAAGLIVIVLGAMNDFGFTFGKDQGLDMAAYKSTLAVGLCSGIIQILLGLFKAGILVEFFPNTMVHGLLTAIGFIIILKQLPVFLGLISWHNFSFQTINPEIAFIGFVSVVILFATPLMKNKWVKIIPSQMLVILVAVPLGLFFDLSHEHTYSFLGNIYPLNEKFLVNIPLNITKVISFPDLTIISTFKSWKWIFMFAVIGSIESMLSAKAIDKLDPLKRQTNYDKDLLAIGIGNTIAAAIGGLPMISEIVRSRANIDNGAKTKFANAFHGLFLLLAIVFFPHWIHEIPLCALAAMLIYTGFRLAHPREFMHFYHLGKNQLSLFVITIVAILMTDLLSGIFIGVAAKILLQMYHGLSLKTIFRKPQLLFTKTSSKGTLHVAPAAIFTHWLHIRKQLEEKGLNKNRSITIDFSKTKMIDNTILEKLEDIKLEFSRRNLELNFVGFDQHKSFSKHPLSMKYIKKAS